MQAELIRVKAIDVPSAIFDELSPATLTLLGDDYELHGSSAGFNFPAPNGLIADQLDPTDPDGKFSKKRAGKNVRR